jgi:hypothetical protein
MRIAISPSDGIAITGADDDAAALYPVSAKGVKDAAVYWAGGTYSMTGYFSGRVTTLADWMTARGEDPDDEERLEPNSGSEFCVESWCYTPMRAPSPADVGYEFWKSFMPEESKALAEMRKNGVRFCSPGS